LAFAGAPLAVVIAAGGSIFIFIGLASAVAVRIVRAPMHADARSLSRSELRSFLGLSAQVFSVSASDLVMYQLDRTILGIFRGASVIGLYEAVVRPQTLVRQIHGSLATTVLPAASAYRAAGDKQREQALALRGTRYVLAATVPVAVVVTIMAGPLLEV